MGAIANTFTTSDAKLNREELSDVIIRITPEDTPLYSLIEKISCSSIHPEWGADDLDSPAENAYPQGDEYTYEETEPAKRYGNYTQIMRKTGIISDTQEAIENATRAEQRKYQKLKKGVELKKDVERAILVPTATVASGTQYFGSLPTWLETNTSRGSGGSDGGYNTSTGLTVVPTNGTQRAFTKTLLDTTMQNVNSSGGYATHLLCSQYVKSVFVTFMSDTNVAQFRYSATGPNNSIIATADVYEGPFGKLFVLPDRVMSASSDSSDNTAMSRNAYLIEPDKLKFAWLRKIQEDVEASNTKTGDASKIILKGEGTLVVKTEKAHGVIADIFGLTSSS